MVRLILITLILLMTLLGVIAVLLFRFLGWKGMVAFPFIVVALVWIGKFVIGKLIQHFALGLFSMKSRALRGATVAVHSVTPVPRPPEPEDEDEEEDEDENDEERNDEVEAEKGPEDGSEAEPAAAEEDEDEAEDSEEEKPKLFYEVDLTITPRQGSEGRVWEPGEFMLASEPVKKLADLEEKEVGHMHSVEIWDGAKFGADDEGKYPGEQRLKLTVALEPGTSRAWLQYYNESLASLEFPAWQPK
jgi:hypothetical protein